VKPSSTPTGAFLRYTDAVYVTPPRRVSPLARAFPSLSFYRRFLAIVFRSSAEARRGLYGDAEWCRSSRDVLETLESVGVRFEITGIEHLERLKSPCVVIANHMSVLETNVLPVVIQPIKPVTFVVKQSLLDYPVFKHVMRSRDPIAVTRDNPREDFKAVIEGGTERLARGISIIVFPQTTRTRQFDASQFNSIGVKLALRANAPVVPLALLTDAWGNGRWIKDFGKIDPARTVHFAFGEPMEIQGRGAEDHQKIVRFIEERLSQWGLPGPG
jgi:1-acyl-sn-glycerol-3-phosphate acyltransferase